MKDAPVPIGPRLDVAKLVAEWERLQQERAIDPDLDFWLHMQGLFPGEQIKKRFERISLLHTWLHAHYLPLRTREYFDTYITERDLLHDKPENQLVVEVEYLFDQNQIKELPSRVHKDPVHFLALVDTLLAPYEKFAHSVATVANAKQYVREQYTKQQKALWEVMNAQQRADAMTSAIQTPAIELRDEDCQRQAVRRTEELTLSENPLYSALSVLHHFGEASNCSLAGAPLLLAAAREFLSRHSPPR